MSSNGANVIEAMITYLSKRARERRVRLFLDMMAPNKEDRILDLGGSDGSHIAQILPHRSNITVADIDTKALELARSKFGFNTILLEEDSPLPIADGSFDIVFCSSVIEHTTVPKNSIYGFRSNRDFKEAAICGQRRFASEIIRISKRYFVQTPYRYFFIESHTWLPIFVVWFPRRIQLAAIRFFNTWWPKQTEPDWSLLTVGDMRELFPEADIIRERWMGMTKSIIAVKNH